MERERATQILGRIVKTIQTGKFPAPVRELYVFGSYARGAANPGDLDLIMIHDAPTKELMAEYKRKIVEVYGNVINWRVTPVGRFQAAMGKVARKPGEKIDIILGTSLSEALSGYRVSDSPRILVWSESEPDWEQKIAAIGIDTSVRRYDRGHFDDMRKFNCDVEMMERATKALNEGIIKLTRTPIAEIKPKLNPLYQHWCDHWINCQVVGKRATKYFPIGMWWIQNLPRQSSRQPECPSGRCPLSCSDRRHIVLFGRPFLSEIFWIGEKKGPRKICMIPFPSRGQIHEMLVFEAGLNYSLKRLDEIWYERPPS